MRRIPARQVARAYGCTEHYAGRVINARSPGSRRFRAFLAEYLNMSESDLFRPAPAERPEPWIGGDAA